MRKSIKKGLFAICSAMLAVAMVFSAITLTSAKADEEEVFELINGASIRVNADYSGIKWDTKVSKAYYDKLKTDYPTATFEFGTLVIPAEYLDNGIEDLSFENAQYNEGDDQFYIGEGYLSILPVKTSIFENAFNPVEGEPQLLVTYAGVINYKDMEDVDRAYANGVALTAKAYLKIDIPDDQETPGDEAETIYLYSGVDTTRSPKAVAIAEYLYNGTESVKEYLKYFDGELKDYEIDETAGYVYLDKNVSGAKTFDFSAIEGETVEKYYLDAVEIEADLEGANLTVDFGDLEGKHFVIAQTATKLFVKEILLGTAISNANEFISAMNYVSSGTTTNDYASLKNLNGYYFLTSDIDFEGATIPYSFTGELVDYNSSSGNDSQYATIGKTGLTGRFDGQGYAIKNVVLPQGGLFGVISGTVKNLAVVDFTFTDVLASYTGALAGTIFHIAKLENVYMDYNGQYRAYGLFLAKYFSDDVVMKNVYCEGEISVYSHSCDFAKSLYWIKINTGGSSQSNGIIVVSKQAMGTNQGWWSDRTQDGIAAYSTTEKPLRGTSVISTCSYHAGYRYVSVSEMKEFYANNATVKGVIDGYNNDCFEVIDGAILWKNGYKDEIDVAFDGEGNEILSTVNLTVGGNPATLTVASVGIKGKVSGITENVSIEIVSGDSFVSNDGLVITAVAEGNAVVNIKCNGKLVKTITVVSILPREAIDKTSMTILIDSLGLTLTTEQKTALELDEGIESLALVDEEVASVDYNSGLITLSNATPNTEYTLKIITETKAISVKIKYYTRVIKTAEDFVSAFDLINNGTTSAAVADLNNFNGYYILANDIDFAGQTMPTDTFTVKETAFTGLNASKATNGLTGTFDGQGYAIKNIVIPEGGLFGTISGTVKNVAIMNFKFATLTNYTGALAKLIHNGAVLENIYFSCESVSGGYGAFIAASIPTSVSGWKNIYCEGETYLYAQITTVDSSTGEYKAFTTAAFSGTESVIAITTKIIGGRSAWLSNEYTANGKGPGTTSTSEAPIGNNGTAVSSMYAAGYRYVSVSEMKMYYANSATVKGIVDGYKNDYFEVIDGAIFWKNSYLNEFNVITDKDGNEVATSINVVVGDTLEIASISIKGKLDVTDIVLESEDGETVSVEGLVLTAEKTGSTNIKIKYQGEVKFVIAIAVQQSYSKEKADTLVKIDQSLTTSQFTAEEIEGIFGEAVVIDSVFPISAGIKVAVGAADNSLVFTNEDDSAFLANGNVYDVVIGAGSALYQIKVMPVTKIIKTADDFLDTVGKLTNVGTNTVNATSFPSKKGYYILANDIYMSTTTKTGTAATSGYFGHQTALVYAENFNGGTARADNLSKDSQIAGIGFEGIFDGANHKISNLILHGAGEANYVNYGVFGFISGNAVVKDVTFENIKVSDTYTLKAGRLLARYVSSTATISNVTATADASNTTITSASYSTLQP